MEIELNGNEFGIAIAIIFVIVLLMIFGMRYFIRIRSKEKLQEKHKNDLSARSKYPEVDIFKYSSTMLGVGVITVLAGVLLSFNFTIYEKEFYIPEYDMAIEEELEVMPPRTPPPSSPPPPPPPQIEEVPKEEIEEEDQDLFKDQTIGDETAMEESEELEAPPLPPPPPAAEPDIVDIFSVVEQMPRFPGCEDLPTEEEIKTCAQKKLLEFIYANISYPAIARENGVKGLVVVRFVVDKDGSISNPEVVRDIGAGTGEEALRVVKLMNKEGKRWIPGKQRGRAVRVQFNLPVKFELQ